MAIRLSGLTLQLAGIITVVWGIISTREFFGLAPISKGLAAWWSRAPFKPRRLAAGTGSVQINMSGEGHAYVTVPVDHSAPVDDRIRVLERSIVMVHERIGGIHSDARKKHQELSALVSKHAAQIAEIEPRVIDRMTGFGTSGLHISAIGAAWLFLGSIMGSASQELSRWLQ